LESLKECGRQYFSIKEAYVVPEAQNLARKKHLIFLIGKNEKKPKSPMGFKARITC